MRASEYRKFTKDEFLKGITDVTDLHTGNNKLKSALAFLKYLDPSGYLCNVADPTKPALLPDDALKERIERIEKMTSAMDVAQYLEYNKVFNST